jgi:hypothetical protein
VSKWRTSLVIALVLTAVALIDAAVSGAWDLVAVLGVVAALLLGVLLATSTGRRPVTLRPDLARALQRRAALSGESVDTLVDRAVAFDVRLQERESWTGPSD